MKTIYLIAEEAYGDYECSASYPVKAFTSEEKAAEYITEANNEITRIKKEIKQYREKSQPELNKYWNIMINKNDYTKKEIESAAKKINELSRQRREKENEIILTFSIGELRCEYLNLDIIYEYQEIELVE